jgi:hypothetical protein
MTTNQEGDSPTGQDVLALYERVVKLIDSGHSKGVYEEFRLFMVEAREYKFARLTRKKGVDHDDDEADHRTEDAHLKAAIEAYPQALAAVQRGEAAARTAAQVPDAQSAVNDEAGSTRQAPPAGEPVARDAAASNANPPGDIEDEGAALDEEPVNADDIAECSESDVKPADWLDTHQIRAPEDRAPLGCGDDSGDVEDLGPKHQPSPHVEVSQGSQSLFSNRSPPYCHRARLAAVPAAAGRWVRRRAEG